MGWKRFWGLTDKDGNLKAVSESEDAPDEVDVAAIARTAGTVAAGESDEVKALREENARLKAAAKAQPSAAQLALDAATAWAEGLVKAEQVLPGEKDALAGLYERAALDDAASPLTAGRTRVGLLKAQVEARPKLQLTTESVGVADLPADARVLPPHKGAEPKATEPTPDGATPSRSRIDHLLGLTDEGRKVLAAAKQ